MEQVVIPVYQDTYDFAHTIELSRPSLFKYMTYSVMSGRDLLSKKVVSEYFAGEQLCQKKVMSMMIRTS